MTAQVVPFTFQEHHPVRVTVINDDPWFCQDWVFKEVLPAICQHGTYVQPAPPVSVRVREPISPAKYYDSPAVIGGRGLKQDAAGRCRHGK